MNGAATWGLRALALGLALTAWFFFSFADRERFGETTVEPFVQYNTARTMTVLNPQLKVRLRLRGPLNRISNLNPLQINVIVDLRDAKVGTREVRLGPESVVTPEELQVVSIEPAVFPVEIDRVISEMKPVDPQLVGEPAAGATVLDPVVTPASVLVSGPASRLKQIAALSTTPVSLDGHALDFEESVAVTSPDPQVRIEQPAVVSVRVPMEIPNGG